jgi:hypothetical protein
MPLHNQAFEYWKSFWEEVFRQNRLRDGEVEFAVDFTRMDLVCLVMSGTEIAGMHLYEFINVEQLAMREHHYFNNETGKVFLDSLGHHGADLVMTLEYLTVNPNWRKKFIGTSLASVVVSLGTRVQAATGAKASLGRAREDVGVNAMAQDCGAVILKDKIDMYNTPVSCICIYSDSIKDIDDPVGRALVQRLWNERVDHSGMTIGNKPRRVAA